MALFTQDRDLRYTWVYQPQLLPPEDVLGKTDDQVLEQLGLPDIKKVAAAKRRVLQTGVPSRTEIRFGEGASARRSASGDRKRSCARWPEGCNRSGRRSRRASRGTCTTSWARR